METSEFDVEGKALNFVHAVFVNFFTIKSFSKLFLKPVGWLCSKAWTIYKIKIVVLTKLCRRDEKPVFCSIFVLHGWYPNTIKQKTADFFKPFSNKTPRCCCYLKKNQPSASRTRAPRVPYNLQQTYKNHDLVGLEIWIFYSSKGQ